MWLDNEGQDAVDLFWQLAGDSQSFPRHLEKVAPLALPIAFTRISHLELNKIERWLWQRRIQFTFQCQSRAVRGCLVAYGGSGFIFVDGADSEDEIHFTQAHEIAHFLLDYWLPRKRALEKFGSAITEVLDGIRSPTIEERLHAIFGKIPIGIHTKLMERDVAGTGLEDVSKIEGRADRVALALLAPPEEVLDRAETSQRRFQERREVVSSLLINSFSLPGKVALAYSTSLLYAAGKGPTWAENLRA